ncbi:MAG: SRPBCC family protein [Burkholderiales bacterium]
MATHCSSRLVTGLAFVVATLGALFQISEAKAAPTTTIDAKAPVISRQDIEISAPIATVWALQTNINGWTAWRPSVSSAHLDGALKAGSAFHWEEGGLQIVSTVQQIQPRRRIVWTGPAQGIFAVHVWEFTPIEGGVRVHTEESWSGAPVDAQTEQLQPLLDGALRDWLTRLKQTSEARAAKATR